MNSSGAQPRLIRSRRGAIVALCLTGLITAASFRDLFTSPRHTFNWLIDLSYFHLPAWTVASFNLAFYAYLLWIAITAYRSTQRTERILVTGWCACGLLGLIQGLFSPFTAAMIDYVQALAMAAAFLAAASILRESPPDVHGNTDSTFEVSGIMTLTMFVVALIFGLMIAFVDSHATWDDTALTLGALILSSGALGLMGPRLPWLWALGIWVWMPIFSWISPNPGLHSRPFALSWGLTGNPVAAAIFGTLGILLFSLAGAYGGVFVRTLLEKFLRSFERSL